MIAAPAAIAASTARPEKTTASSTQPAFFASGRAVFSTSAMRCSGVNRHDLIKNDEVQLLINTPLGQRAQRDDYSLRQAAIAHRVAYTTTLSAAAAACDAILSLKSRRSTVMSIQEWQETIP